MFRNNNLWLSCILLLIILCSVGATGVQVKTNNTDLKSTFVWNGFKIDRDGYFIINITNNFEYDIYNISFDIKFVGGVIFFKTNSETNVFVDQLSPGETVEVKSDNPIIKPKPIIRRPLFLGYYTLTIDAWINGTYSGQNERLLYGLLIYLFIL